jgi:hypothetical protein
MPTQSDVLVSKGVALHFFEIFIQYSILVEGGITQQRHVHGGRTTGVTTHLVLIVIVCVTSSTITRLHVHFKLSPGYKDGDTVLNDTYLDDLPQLDVLFTGKRDDLARHVLTMLSI